MTAIENARQTLLILLPELLILLSATAMMTLGRLRQTPPTGLVDRLGDSRWSVAIGLAS